MKFWRALLGDHAFKYVAVCLYVLKYLDVFVITQGDKQL